MKNDKPDHWWTEDLIKALAPIRPEPVLIIRLPSGQVTDGARRKLFGFAGSYSYR